MKCGGTGTRKKPEDKYNCLDLVCGIKNFISQFKPKPCCCCCDDKMPGGPCGGGCGWGSGGGGWRPSDRPGGGGAGNGDWRPGKPGGGGGSGSGQLPGVPSDLNDPKGIYANGLMNALNSFFHNLYGAASTLKGSYGIDGPEHPQYKHLASCVSLLKSVLSFTQEVVSAGSFPPEIEQSYKDMISDFKSRIAEFR